MGVRLAYLDGLRGAALVLMVLNHTGRWWIEGHMTWPRYHFNYLTLTIAAPTFLFLVGFCLPLSLRSHPETADRLVSLARKFVPRGVRIAAAGLLLNLLVFPEEPIQSGGVLQTIGLAIIAMVPAIWLLRTPAGAWALVLVAAAGYVAFVVAFPWLTAFVAAYPRIGLVLFYDFPPWPWLSLVLLGLVLGTRWLATHDRDPGTAARHMRIMAIAGALMVAAFVVVDWLLQTPVRFGMKRDYILNHHWTPRGPTLLWVLGMVLLMLAAAYWVMEVRGWRLRALVLFGQTSFFLYFAHQLIAMPVVTRWLGWHFDTWPGFALANALFLVLLLGIGWSWLALKRVLSAWRRGAHEGSPAH